MNQKRPLFILAGNGPYDNRGCEAIVRGTVEILRSNYENPIFVCISNFENLEQFERQVECESDTNIIHKMTNRSSLKYKKYTVNSIFRHLNEKLRPDIYRNVVYKDMLDYIKDANAILSIGGDNYSLDYGIPKLFTDLDDIALKNKIPIIIWGASIGPFEKVPIYEKYMSSHLKKIDGVFVRESVTLEYLSHLGVNDNVYHIADPAFVLKPVKPVQENKMPIIEDNSIGINLSPLMARYVCNGDVIQWTRNAAKIVDSISEKITSNIYLISHVTTSNSNDYTFLKNVLNLLSTPKKNVFLVPPLYNSEEAKWIISNMSIFIGSRTHSTIAALSSCVPTLTLSYSTKAIGINKDIFGHDRYCLKSDELIPENVLEKTEHILKNREEISRYLQNVIPEFEKKALDAGIYLKNMGV